VTVTSDQAATKLSTAPEPVAPRGVARVTGTGPGRRQVMAALVRRTWRQLTSMRTALQLLFLLALASVPGSFLPQRGLNPVAVQQYFVDNPTLAPVLDTFYAFDVFAAPWFAAVYLLLFISLVGCLSSRLKLHATALVTPPPAVPRTLSRMPASQRWESQADAEATLSRARTLLRKRRWRVVVRDGSLSAEKGYLRESGNLLFHVSLVVLLVGIAMGGLLGFQGTVLVKEGDGFANTVLAYDDIKPGRRFDADRLVPFSFVLDDFQGTYGDDGKALTFLAKIRYAGGADDEPRPYDLRVNHPLVVGGAKTYLLGHGYAPKVRIVDREGNVLEQTVACLPQGPTFLSTCTIKVPDAAGEQLAFEGVFTPTTVQDPQTGLVTSVYPAPENPALTVLGYRGDLGIDSGTPASVYNLPDRSGLVAIGDGTTPQKLLPGQTWELPGGGSLTFVETTEWATFQVTQDPGKLVALIASIGMVLGLCLSLFVRRRRLWVRVGPAGGPGRPGRTVVEIAGLSRTHSEAFSAEFAQLADRVRQTAPPHPTSEELV
jgi:cytochrome c biogenesis protein